MVKYLTARAILVIGYGLIFGAIGAVLWNYATPIFIIIGSISGVFLVWVAFAWSIEGFAWAHKNWRKT